MSNEYCALCGRRMWFPYMNYSEMPNQKRRLMVTLERGNGERIVRGIDVCGECEPIVSEEFLHNPLPMGLHGRIKPREVSP